MKNVKYLILALVVVMVYFLFFRSPDSKSGEKAPNFSAELIDGTPFELSDLKGKYVLLDFWGSWCAPCRRDNPKLAKLYQSFKDTKFNDAEGFEVVTVALEKDDKRWKKASLKDGFTWPYQIVTTARVVLLSPIAQKYNVSNVPTKFLINPEGNIIGVNQEYEALNNLQSKIREDQPQLCLGHFSYLE